MEDVGRIAEAARGAFKGDIIAAEICSKSKGAELHPLICACLRAGFKEENNSENYSTSGVHKRGRGSGENCRIHAVRTPFMALSAGPLDAAILKMVKLDIKTLEAAYDSEA